MNRFFQVLAIAICSFALSGHAQQPASSDIRPVNPGMKFVALVIGNSNYAHVPVLPGVANDASDVARLFGTLGFTISNAGRMQDLTKAQMAAVIGTFLNRLDEKTVAVVYFSGHGLEDKGTNYLVPVDANVQTPDDVFSQLMSLNELVRQMESRGARTRIVILDACRNMPEMLKSKDIGGAGGLRDIALLGPGTKLIYAAAPGQKALPAAANQRNSVFTSALLQASLEPLGTLDQVLNRAGEITVTATNGRQNPWLSGSLGMSVRLAAKSSPHQPEPVRLAPEPVRESVSMRGLLGVDLSLGEPVSKFKGLVPNAEWGESKGMVYASFPGRFVALHAGETIVWFEKDRISQFTFIKKEQGATWDQYRLRSGDWEIFKTHQNGQKLSYTEAVDRCRPLNDVKSLLTREFGAVVKVVAPDRTFDTTTEFQKDPRVIRTGGPVGREWRSEYQRSGMLVSASLESRGWEFDRKNTSLSAEDVKFQSCEFRLDFRPTK